MFDRWRSRRFALVVTSGVLVAAPLAAGVEAAPVWGPDEAVSTHTFDAFERPETRVGVASDGTAFTAWLQEDAGGSTIYVARRAANGIWSGPLALSPVEPYQAWDLSVGASDHAAVVWSRVDSGTPRVYESHFQGGGWTSPTLVGDGSGPDVGVDGTGRITVAWARDGVRMRTRSASGTWTDESLFSADPSAFITVEANASGAVVIAWQRFSAPRMVRAALQPAYGDWGSARNLMVRKRIASLDAAISDSGQAFVAWTTTGEWDDPAHVYRNGVAWARTRPSGDWSDARYLNRNIGEDGGALDVAMNATGQALVTWMAAGGGSNGWKKLHAARYELGHSWGPARKLARGWYAPRAWIDDDGFATVIGDRSKIWQFTQAVGGPWSAPIELARGDLGDATGLGHRLLLVWLGNDEHLHGRVLDTP